MQSDLISWPESLPTPLIGRGHDFDPKSVRTVMDSGRIRNRRMTATTVEFIKVTWNFTEDKYAEFQTFFVDTIENGSLHFLLITYEKSTIPHQITEVDREVAFTEPKYSVAHSDNLYAVTASLEVVETIRFEIEDPSDPPPVVDITYPPTIDEFGEEHVCRDTFKLRFKVKAGVHYVVQICDTPYLASPWSNHVYFTATVDETKEMEFNNDYPRITDDVGFFYFRVVKAVGIHYVTIASPAKPLPSVVYAPSVTITNLPDAPYPRGLWSDGGNVYAYSNVENALISSSGIYVVPRGRKTWFSGTGTIRLTDAWPEIVAQTVGPNQVELIEAPGAYSTYTRDGSDPEIDTAMPLLDGVENNAAIARDDFGMGIRARSFIGFCKSPVTLVLVDKEIWSWPWNDSVSKGNAVSGRCDYPRTDLIRKRWERDESLPSRPFLYPLDSVVVESGTPCPVNPFYRQMLTASVATAVDTTTREYIFTSGFTTESGGTIAFYGTGDGGEYRTGFIYEFSTAATIFNESWNFRRIASVWDKKPKVFTNPNFSLTHHGARHWSYLPISSQAYSIAGFGGASTELARLVALPALAISELLVNQIPDGEWYEVTFDINVVMTLHNDFRPPGDILAIPPDPITPPGPKVNPAYYEDWDSYPNTTDATGITMNGASGWTGAWTVSNGQYITGRDDFQTYTVGVIASTDTLNGGEEWYSEWSFSDGVDNIVEIEDFQSYSVGVVGLMDAGTQWTGIWTVTDNYFATGLDDFETYPDEDVPSSDGESDGSNWSQEWSFSDSFQAIHLDTFQSYSDGTTTGTENGGDGWGSMWSFT